MFFRRERAKPNVMSGHRIVFRAGDESQRLIVKGKVLGFDRKQTNQRLDNRGSQGPRYARVNFRPAMSPVHRITSEEFIAAIAAQARQSHACE